jgi:L-ascorbate metabolism protein UlaG (beta-lactamase superfamily)
MSKPLTAHCFGHTDGDTLTVSPGPCSIGRAEDGPAHGTDDGVALEHGRAGAWVISFADLERIYFAAKAARP